MTIFNGDLGREERLFQERSDFILRNYPGDGKKMIREVLDGFEVIEDRDESGNLRGILTYDMGVDRIKKEKYCVVGLILVDEDSRGDGGATSLFNQLRHIKDSECDYYTAKADTKAGEKLLLSLGFDDDSEVDGKRCFRLDV